MRIPIWHDIVQLLQLRDSVAVRDLLLAVLAVSHGWLPPSIPTDPAHLTHLHEAAVQRAEEFIQKQKPNKAEAAVCKQLLNQPAPEMLQHGFTYLIGYEWNVPCSLEPFEKDDRLAGGRWDMLFANSDGALLALEAKGSSSKTGRAARQSQIATGILTAQGDRPALPEPWRSTYAGRTVYSGVCHDEGFQWVIGPHGIISGSLRRTADWSAACKPTAAKASANGSRRVQLPVGVLPLWHNSLMPLPALRH